MVRVVMQTGKGPTDGTVAIKQDAADPDFLKNLHRLGPVTVDHHTKAFETVRCIARNAPDKVPLTHFLWLDSKEGSAEHFKVIRDTAESRRRGVFGQALAEPSVQLCALGDAGRAQGGSNTPGRRGSRQKV